MHKDKVIKRSVCEKCLEEYSIDQIVKSISKTEDLNSIRSIEGKILWEKHEK